MHEQGRRYDIRWSDFAAVSVRSHGFLAAFCCICSGSLSRGLRLGALHCTLLDGIDQMSMAWYWKMFTAELCDQLNVLRKAQAHMDGVKFYIAWLDFSYSEEYEAFLHFKRKGTVSSLVLSCRKGEMGMFVIWAHAILRILCSDNLLMYSYIYSSISICFL